MALDQQTKLGIYQHKPTRVVALQWQPGEPEAVAAMLRFLPESHRRYMVEFSDRDEIVGVYTLHGLVVAKEGDWICRGPGGDFWPVEDGIFTAGYDWMGDATPDGTETGGGADG